MEQPWQEYRHWGVRRTVRSSVACYLSVTAEFLYKTTDYYATKHKSGIVWNDLAIAIQWLFDGELAQSRKDRQGQSLAEAECFT